MPRGQGFEEELLRLIHRLPGGEEGRGYGVHFENDTFYMHPYCWCDKDECPQCGTGEQFNFFYKPTGYGIRWYKYILRDSYATDPVKIGKFSKMIDACVASLGEAGK